MLMAMEQQFYPPPKMLQNATNDRISLLMM
jgi:hypothetical protein